jgi:hypothetical protein
MLHPPPQVKGAASHAAHELEEEAKDNKTGLYTGEFCYWCDNLSKVKGVTL